ncbi:MAG: phosphoribosyltransferase family protein [Bacteroidetes bacterium]|nr:phosphoribosyltransferase family protein [Bacteroidota bacterium]MDA1336276.1 phosphoribosyltransferase family protein [Bacteroidota bacterium]
MSRTRILESQQIERKLQRIARQILEDFHDASDLYLISIEGNGQPVGHRLQLIIEEIGSIKVIPALISLNKINPLDDEIRLNADLDSLRGKNIVIVDDVLNSGKTLMYAVHHILAAGPSRVATAVLIDRIHRSFPVRADYCGLSLSTNLKEHIDVIIENQCAPSDEAILHD